MFPEYTREELAAGLDEVVADLLCEAAVTAPPVDAFEVAGRLGIEVAWDDRQQGRARYVRLRSRGSGHPRATILLHPEPRFERRQWAVAHEIGEHAAYRVFARWGADPREAPPDARELVANHLAGRLLLPTAWFAADAAACDWDLLRLKSRYSTASHELIARRMLECRPPIIVSIFDNGRLSLRRSNVPGRVPPPADAEVQCWHRVQDTRAPSRSVQDRGLVQGWPVHEDEWKREILRTEVREWDVLG